MAAPATKLYTLHKIISGNQILDRIQDNWISAINPTFALGTSRIQSKVVPAPLASNDGQLIAWNQTSNQFEYSDPYTPTPSGVSAGSYGNATHVGAFTVDTFGFLTAASNVAITGIPPGGSAGGDLSGTYPDPAVAKINGVALGATTNNAGNLLVAQGLAGGWTSEPMTGAATLGVPCVLTLVTQPSLTPATYGDSTHVAQFTVSAQGIVEFAAAVAISGVSPAGAAGGALAGSYPNPTLAGVITGAGPIGSSTAIPVITYNAAGQLTTVTTATPAVPAGLQFVTNGNYTQPNVGSTVAVTFVSVTGLAASTTPPQCLQIWDSSGNGGYYSVGAITSLTATLTHLGAIGGSARGSTVASGAVALLDNTILGRVTELVGSGEDGVLTVGNSNVTLVRDMEYKSIAWSSAATGVIKPSGFALRVQTFIDFTNAPASPIQGSQAQAGSAGANTGTGGAVGVDGTTGSLGIGTGSGAGGTATSTTAANGGRQGTAAGANGGQSGAGGNGGTGLVGAGGSGGATSLSQPQLTTRFSASLSYGVRGLMGGVNGSGGGAGGWATGLSGAGGGGGGAGGEVIALYCGELVRATGGNAPLIVSSGATGGAGGTGNSGLGVGGGGGAGGGAGGWIYLWIGVLSGTALTGAISVPGGTGGVGGNGDLSGGLGLGGNAGNGGGGGFCTCLVGGQLFFSPSNSQSTGSTGTAGSGATGGTPGGAGQTLTYTL